jgi:deoxyadenosine/deoxycytidine kinase
MQQRIVSIEANIGAGKTTVLQHLQKMLDNQSVLILEEPVDEWTTTIPSVFTEYYKDTTKYAFSIQTMIYSSIRKRLENISSQYPVIVTERSLGTCSNVFAKMLYDNGQLNEIEYKIYNNYVSNDPILPNIMIYLKTTPEFCYKNIQTRSRKGENQITLEYLQQCHDAHESWCENLFTKIESSRNTDTSETKHPAIIVLDVSENTPPEETAKQIFGLYKSLI